MQSNSALLNLRLKIETSLKHETIFVSVKDSGCGIPKDSLNKIWDRFYKIDSSRGKDRKGTGLGLSIVKEIIRSHNQHINVISTEASAQSLSSHSPEQKRETDRLNIPALFPSFLFPIVFCQVSF